uniref:Protein kinase n=1 Tax=Pithovirus LCPAC406 TaxID=2506599 RepID=A0A481ZDN9_9VIRU|nr:MAG: protein kinase [Pithovirus LCPAC406]
MTHQSSSTVMRRRSSNVIKRFDNRALVVDTISDQSPLCSKIDDDLMDLTGILGKGKYATVWDAKLKDQRESIAVKVPHDSLEIVDVKAEDSGENLGEFSSRNSEFNENLTIKLNGGNPNRKIESGDILKVPKFSRRCLTMIDISLNTITIPKGTYLCRNETYSEFLISLLCSGLAKSRSINFMDIMDLSMCPESKLGEVSYMFQEKMIGALGDGLIKIDDSILIQVFHAIACYQENYAISHNDLHTGNILYTEYVGLEETTHLAFVLDDVILYIPKPKYIIKIGDFGRSCKYSDFMILNYDVVNNEYPIPVNYSKFYDLGTSMMSMLGLILTSPLLLKCITYILQDDVVGPESKYREFFRYSNHPLSKYFDEVHKRPRIDMLDEPPLSDMSAYKLLRSPVFNRFRRRPIGNIVVVATI